MGADYGGDISLKKVVTHCTCGVGESYVGSAQIFALRTSPDTFHLGYQAHQLLRGRSISLAQQVFSLIKSLQ